MGVQRVLVSDRVSEKGLEILRGTEGISVDVRTGLSTEELRSIIGDYQALVVRSSTRVTAEVIDAAGKLRVIGRAGIGVDNVDVPAATRKGIVVMNTPQGNAVAAAEHTISMMCALARKIPQATAALKSGQWDRGRFMGVELGGKILGLVGIGNIGSIVAGRAQGLMMKVIAHDPYVTEEMARAKGVEPVSMEELLARSDFISVHTPLTDETRNLIDRSAFAKMRRGVMIINCARGGIVNERALHEALESGRVAGAALDCFEVEPPLGNPLLEFEQVICTPHLGASTEEAQEKVAVAIAEQLVDYLTRGVLQNTVNVPSVNLDLLPDLMPFSDLAERLGRFLAQLFGSAIEEVAIQYVGDVTRIPLAPLKAAALKGLLHPHLGDIVNFVNAPLMAEERGIAVVERSTSKAEDYTSLISIAAGSRDESHSITGSIFGRKQPRLLELNDSPLGGVLAGHLLVIRNEDRPGVIGNIGSVLGKKGINIASINVGRDRAGGRGITLLSLDAPLAKPIIDEISGLPHVMWVKQLELPLEPGSYLNRGKDS
ncbi:MAG: phosphoglycerate dehydrogenase [Deltaproteobacteria bacterium]|nr:phosphoglycerate dehydrogenase [Deltaproteobacteria bacterium]MBW2123425.1 phosphoglycerate dehydrogenase [Deltaproteobacteria bacterium]